MTTPDFPDWQQAVAIVDSAAQLTSGAVVLSTGQSTPALDTSDVNSVLIEITPPQITAAGQRYELFLLWKESGVNYFQETLTYHSAQSYATAVDRIMWILPARTATLTALLRGSDGSTSTVIVSGSTRVLPSGKPRIFRGNVFRVLLDTSFGSIAAGATSATVYVPPSAEQVLVRLNQKIATVQAVVRTINDPTVPSTTAIATILGTDPTNAGQPIPVPAQGLEISVTNSDTVAHTTTLSVVDASY